MRIDQYPLIPSRARLTATARQARNAMFTAVLAAAAFLVPAMPASAGTTQFTGTGFFNDSCQAPVGDIPADTGNLYPPIDISGDLRGCWYTYVTYSQTTPSGAYLEQGNELFVGCLNGTICGSFRTIYSFTGKFEADGTELHGRCEHSVVDGTGDFAGANGVINIKDDPVNLTFGVRGQIQLGAQGQGREYSISGEQAAKLSAGLAKVGGC